MGLGYLWVEWTFDFDFVLLFCFLLLFLLGLEKFQILLSVLFILLSDEPMVIELVLFGGFNFAVNNH